MYLCKNIHKKYNLLSVINPGKMAGLDTKWDKSATDLLWEATKKKEKKWIK